MNNNFPKDSQLKCIIPCAGAGTRILPYSQKTPKVMIEINGRPILAHVIDYWRNFTNDFIFVVGYKKNQVIDFVKKTSVNAQFVEQKKLGGIADAISCAENLVSNNFIVALGDCICTGKFYFPQNIKQGIGVWKTKNIDDIKRSYSLEIKKNLVTNVNEKPREVPNNLCGTGYYLFNKIVFDYIKNTKPSRLRNEIEITDVIQKMIKNGEKIKPFFLRGSYLNVTYPDDIKIAENIFNNARYF